MRKRIISLIIVVAGLLLLGYPWISNWFYENSVDSTVEVYKNNVETIDRADLEQMLEEARAYNKQLESVNAELKDPFIPSDEEMNTEYDNILSLDDSGMMCIIDIPKIDVYLPVYHGSSSEVLKKGAGHLQGSSLPVGGENTHAVISAHTGLQTSKMFTDLTELKDGDLFFIHILDETLAYRVCDVQIVLPDQTDGLAIQKGRDLVSLVTCTPYGLNTHRLIVTGERTEYTEAVEEEAEKQEPEESSQWMEAYKTAMIIGLNIVAVLACVLKIVRNIRRRRKYSPWLRGGKH